MHVTHQERDSGLLKLVFSALELTLPLGVVLDTCVDLLRAGYIFLDHPGASRLFRVMPVPRFKPPRRPDHGAADEVGGDAQIGEFVLLVEAAAGGEELAAPVEDVDGLHVSLRRATHVTGLQNGIQGPAPTPRR